MNIPKLLRSPFGWALFVLLTITCIVYVYFNFNKANSLINIEITMDRGAALNQAYLLSRKFNLGPEKFKQAAAFIHDSHFQNFAELEGGGIDSITSCTDKGYYMPFVWSVRHFREHDAHEAVFWFTPDGKPYGFSEEIPESEKGASLNEAEALKIAENHAVNDWETDLANYTLIEKTREEVISGRIDHTFVYERKDVRIGNGNFRLKLVVSGDKLTTIENFVKIPEDFDRRYSEMRSSNDTIQSISTAIIALIYGLTGVVLGLFFLIRKRWIIWKKPVFWGFGIALASVFLITVNNLPFSWFNYDTSSSQGNFLLRELLYGFLGATGLGSIIAVSVMAAEGLGRKAFPGQIQLWKIWDRKTASSLPVLGQTISGYLFAAVMLGIDVLFYVLTTRHLGWWSPAGTLSDPNILATYFPWLDSIATSLQAGFWEESLFRAVPIAGVVLLTQNRKSRNIWIVLILLIQTLVFGSAHANYPNQPSYARVIEMIIPFTIMGVIYIYFGLLPAIIAHFTVDVFWISLPLWVSSSSGIWFDRIIVVLILFLPLWIVIFSRLRNKKWEPVPYESRNEAWLPLPKKEEKPEEPAAQPLPVKNRDRLLIPLAIAGLSAWLFLTPFKPDSPGLEVTRKEAIRSGEKTISEKYKINTSEWVILTSVNNQVDFRDIFAWREGSKSIYHSLLGKFLPPPAWNVRFVKTKGKVEERDEEFNVTITGNGKVTGIYHKIPESEPGKNLEKSKVQNIADSTLFTTFSLQREKLKEISISPEKLENRTDWEFEYADTINFPLRSGQGRYYIKISGDEVTSTYPYLFVPEEWTRNYREEQNINSVFHSIGLIVVLGIIGFGLIWGIAQWIRKKFNFRIFLLFSLLYLAFNIIKMFNNWPESIAGYLTQVPYTNYTTQLFIGMVISSVFISLLSGIIAGSSLYNISAFKKPGKFNIGSALGLGLLITGLFALSEYLSLKTKPEWISLEGLNSYSPVIGFGLSGITGLILYPAFGITLFRGIDILTNGWTKKKFPGVALFLVAGLGFMASGYQNFYYWIISGLIAGFLMILIYLYFIRTHFEWLPVAMGIIPVMNAIHVMVCSPFKGTLTGGLLFILLSFLILVFWYKELVSFKKSQKLYDQ